MECPYKALSYGEDRNVLVPSHDILASQRVNVDYAEEDANIPCRFRIRKSPWTSRLK
jgi:DNA-3-methyladenine glycosylase